MGQPKMTSGGKADVRMPSQTGAEIRGVVRPCVATRGDCTQRCSPAPHPVDGGGILPSEKRISEDDSLQIQQRLLWRYL